MKPRFRVAALAQLGQYELATFLYREVLAAGHNSASIWNNLGYCLMRHGELKEAERTLSQALVLDPLLSPARYNRAMVGFRRARGDRAPPASRVIADVELAADVFPQQPDVLLLAARLHCLAEPVSTAGLDRAIQFVERAITAGANPHELREESLLAPLRNLDRFQRITVLPRPTAAPQSPIGLVATAD